MSGSRNVRVETFQIGGRQGKQAGETCGAIDGKMGLGRGVRAVLSGCGESGGVLTETGK